MGNWLVVTALVVTMVQFQEYALNLVKMQIGVLFLVLVLVLYLNYYPQKNEESSIIIIIINN